MFFLISTHFTAPPGIPRTSPALQSRRLATIRRVSRRLITATYATAYTPFTPSNSGQRLPPTSYRGCWHVVCRGFLRRYRPALARQGPRPDRQSFTTRRPSSLTRRCSIRLAPIVEDSLLLPPVGVWAVSQSQCGRSPSQAGYPSEPWGAITPPTS